MYSTWITEVITRENRKYFELHEMKNIILMDVVKSILQVKYKAPNTHIRKGVLNHSFNLKKPEKREQINPIVIRRKKTIKDQSSNQRSIKQIKLYRKIGHAKSRFFLRILITLTYH